MSDTPIPLEQQIDSLQLSIEAACETMVALRVQIVELAYSAGMLLAAANAQRKSCPFCSVEIREIRAQHKLVYFETNGRVHPCTPGYVPPPGLKGLK